MNVREVIAALRRQAKAVGEDAEVRVVMCDGESSEVARVIEVDNMAEFASDAPPPAAPREVFVIVQGHPHLEDNPMRLHGVAHGAELHLRKWASEQ